jgi:iron(III) transport system permease protein
MTKTRNPVTYYRAAAYTTVMPEFRRSRVIGIATALLAVFATLSLLAIREERIWRLLGNTLILALGSSALSVPVGTLLAILLFRTDLFLRRLLGIAVVVMLFVPLYLQAAGWDAGFGRLGWFSFSLGQVADPLLGGWGAAIWIHGLAGIPWVVLVVGTALRHVEAEFEELALLEAPSVSVLWRVTLRRCLPAIGVATIWILIATAGEMTVTDLYGIRTYAEEVYLAIPQGEFDEIGMQWQSFVLVIAFLTSVAFPALFRLAPTSSTTPSRSLVMFRLGALGYVSLGFTLVAVLLIVGLPLGNLVANAGIVVEKIEGDFVRSWQFGKFLRIVVPAVVRFSDEFRWTLLIGSVSATAVVLMAIPMAWWAGRHLVGSVFALGTAAICLATPGPVTAVVLIGLLNRESDFVYWLYDRTILAPCLAAFVKGLPLAILISWYTLRSVAPDALEAAAAEGAGSMQRLWKIAVPQRFGAFAAAWLAAFAIAMGDLAATILVAPPGVTTIGMRVFGLLHSGVDDHVAGLCLTSFAMFSSIAVLALFAGRALTRQTRR